MQRGPREQSFWGSTLSKNAAAAAKRLAKAFRILFASQSQERGVCVGINLKTNSRTIAIEPVAVQPFKNVVAELIAVTGSTAKQTTGNNRASKKSLF